MNQIDPQIISKHPQIKAFKDSVDIVIASTGFSDPQGDDKHLDERIFIASGKRILREGVEALLKTFPEIRIGIVHGSTPRGIDLIAQQVAEALDIPQLGLTCMAWIEYMPTLNPHFPMVVLDDQNAFRKLMASIGDFVFQYGGRSSAIDISVNAAVDHQNFAIVVSPATAIYGRTGLSALGANIGDPTSEMLEKLIRIKASMRGYDQFSQLITDTVAALVPRIRLMVGEVGFASLDVGPKPQKVALTDLELNEWLPCYNPDSVQYPDEVVACDGKDVLSLFWKDSDKSNASGTLQMIRFDENSGRYLHALRIQELTVVEEQFAGNISTYLESPKRVVLGATGYSSLKAKDLQAMGVEEGVYAAAVQQYLVSVISELVSVFPDVQFVLADGGSDAEVDRAVINAAHELAPLGVQRVGHTCDRYLRYCKDQEGLVILSKTSDDYGHLFVKHVDVLFGLGGRSHALKLDLKGVAQGGHKLLVLPELTATISRFGGAQPSHIGGELHDASALFDSLIRLVNPDFSSCYDPITDVSRQVAAQMVDVVRRILPTVKKFNVLEAKKVNA